MSEDGVVSIPYCPRPYQAEIHEQLEKHRFAVIVMHRRAGKTVMVLNHMLRCALQSRRLSSLFAYIAPFRDQAKAIAWRYLQHFSAPVPGRKFNQTELSVAFPNGSAIRLFGADNADALRGLRFDGVVMDEVADMKPSVWMEVVRPALSDRNGWGIFIGTPRGQNLFFEMFQEASAVEAKGGQWCAIMRRVDETGALPAEEIASLQAEMSANAFRQEYLCDFSASADDVLIPIDLVTAAAARVYKPADVRGIPVVMGVDVARTGADATVFCFRQGLNCEPVEVFHGLDNMAVADRVAARLRDRPEVVHCCIDVGMGAGVIDRLRAMGFGRRVMEVPFGSAALDDNRYLNRRAEMWMAIRTWLEDGGALPNDPALKTDLAMPRYSFNTAGKVQLEKKEDIRKRLGRSPDRADALALTFAVPVRIGGMATQSFHVKNSRQPRWR